MTVPPTLDGAIYNTDWYLEVTLQLQEVDWDGKDALASHIIVYILYLYNCMPIYTTVCSEILANKSLNLFSE